MPQSSKKRTKSPQNTSGKISFLPVATIEVTIRSFLFNVAFIGGTTFITLASLPLLCFPKQGIIFIGRCWAFCVDFLLKYIVGLSFEIKGKVPQGGAFIASKHQSTWETIMFFRILEAPVCLMKKELFNIPLLGWYFRKSGMVKVERAKSAFPLKLIVNQMQEIFKERRDVIIFPEGTRTDPFAHKSYKPGIALMYEALGKEVIPVALNAGLFWGRRSFLKYPGKVIIEFLEPIPAGLPPKKFLEVLESTIEKASIQLREEALQRVQKS